MTREETELTIDYLKNIQEGYIEGEGYDRHPLPEWYALNNAIEALEQEPKTGHWIEHPHEWGNNWEYSQYECSVCHNLAHFDTDFCPNCGAKMESE